MYISNFNPVGRFESYFFLSYKVNDNNSWSIGAQAKAFIGVYVSTVNVSNVFMMLPRRRFAFKCRQRIVFAFYHFPISLIFQKKRASKNGFGCTG